MSTSAPAPRIRITADDYGLHKDINAGIIACVNSGLINAISVSVCGSEFNTDAIAQLGELTRRMPHIDIGIHLMLTEGTPLLEQSKTGPARQAFYSYVKDLGAPLFLGKISPGQVQAEWRAQIDKLSNAGFMPSFITSHQHVHILPFLLKPVRHLQREFNIPEVRSSYQSLSQALAMRSADMILFQFLARYLYKTTPDARKTLGVLCSMNFSLKAIHSALAQALKKNEPIEIMVHPAYATTALRTAFPTWNAMWDKEISELALLKTRIAELTAT